MRKEHGSLALRAFLPMAWQITGQRDKRGLSRSRKGEREPRFFDKEEMLLPQYTIHYHLSNTKHYLARSLLYPGKPSRPSGRDDRAAE